MTLCRSPPGWQGSPSRRAGTGLRRSLVDIPGAEWRRAFDAGPQPQVGVLRAHLLADSVADASFEIAVPGRGARHRHREAGRRPPHANSPRAICRAQRRQPMSGPCRPAVGRSGVPMIHGRANRGRLSPDICKHLLLDRHLGRPARTARSACRRCARQMARGELAWGGRRPVSGGDRARRDLGPRSRRTGRRGYRKGGARRAPTSGWRPVSTWCAIRSGAARRRATAKTRS